MPTWEDAFSYHLRLQISQIFLDLRRCSTMSDETDVSVGPDQEQRIRFDAVALPDVFVLAYKFMFARGCIGGAEDLVSVVGEVVFRRVFICSGGEFQQSEVGTSEQVEQANLSPLMISQRGVWGAVSRLEGGRKRGFALGQGPASVVQG